MPDRHSLRHDLDGATTEEQVVHLALQREGEVDLTGYATERWVKKQGYLTSIPDIPEVPDVPDVPNIPDIPSPSLDSVLEAGNKAKPGQSIRMEVDESDLEEIEAILGSFSGGTQSKAIDIEGRSGLRIGGCVSTYTFNEPITIDLAEGDVSTFQVCHRRTSAPGDFYTGGTSLGDYSEVYVGVGGFQYWADDCLNISIHSYNYKVECKNDAGEEGLKIYWHRSSNRSYVKADEFIGDGSKLTNLPVDEDLAGAISDLQEGLEGHTHSDYASTDHTHDGYASSSHNHTGTYVKGNYTISKVNGNYYIS